MKRYNTIHLYTSTIGAINSARKAAILKRPSYVRELHQGNFYDSNPENNAIANTHGKTFAVCHKFSSV
jgi:hypothetical protein